jgi:3',5'-cyclic-AMP phosphodiesterase
VPVEHCLGNHDILGFCRSKAELTGTEPDFGYARPLAELKLASRWRSFDRNGWHFVVLSSVEADPDNECSYLAKLNPEQRAWLEADLAKNTLPTVVVSHIPIVTVTPHIRGETEVKAKETTISGGFVHLDAAPIHSLFRKSGKVRLVLSGHTHLIDRCEADGVTYCCSGAVCGGWWKPHKTYCEPTWALIDLMSDGSFRYEIKPTGWTNG